MASKACLTTPVAVVGKYEEKGDWTDVDGLKTYTSGSAQAHKGILYIFDIFGFSSQTLQGADILATGGGGGGRDDYLVVMPDFFEGATMQQEWFPTDTEEKKAKAQNFMAGPADISKAVPRAGKVMQELRVKYPHMEDWSAIGYCWGGKLLALTSQKGSSTGFKCGIQTSPGRLDPEDAKKIEIPMAVLASQGEGEEVVKKYEEALGGEKYVERFGDMVHGWMSARADLGDERVKAEYERGYKIALEFFDKWA